MFDESSGSALGECSITIASSSGIHATTTRMFPTHDYEIGGFVSPTIPQMHPQGLRPPLVFEFGSVFSAQIQLESVQDRIDKSHWICDYSDDIFQTLRESEMKRRLVCFRSQQVEFRPNLLKLLKEATEKHKLARTTLHLAVYLLDCFMDNYTIRFDKLKLTAITCLIVAAKIEEADIDMPKFGDLNKLVNKSYLLQEFKNVECKVLGTFNFDLIRPTAATFAEYFANSFVTLQDYHVYLNHWNNEMTLNSYHHYTQEQQRHDESVFQEARENDYALSTLQPIANTPCPYSSYEDMLTTLISQSLVIPKLELTSSYRCLFVWNLKFVTTVGGLGLIRYGTDCGDLKFANARPSIIASSCIAAVRQIHGIFPIWTPYLVKLTACTADIISPFVEAIIAIYRLYCNKELLQQIETPNTPITSGTINSSILCDSPDSGIVLDNDTKSTISDDEVENCDIVHHEAGDTDEEDEPYNCLEYPLLPKRRRIS